MSMDLEYRSAQTTIVRRSSFARFIADNNPCYLLSAACMLLGMMTLTNSLSFSPIPLHRIIALIGTLNLYETILIGLAIWLVARRRIMRDAEILLAIEALFLADGAMLSSEIFTVDLRVGAIVNAMLLAFAVGKLWLVMTALRLPIARTVLPLAALQLLVLGLPGLLKYAAEAHGGRLSPIVLYAAWWMTAIVPVLMAMVARAASSCEGNAWIERRALSSGRRIAITFAAMSGASIVIHLALASWVYKVDWLLADAAPILLGSAVAAILFTSRTRPNPACVRAQYILTALAVLSSFATPAELSIGEIFALTPLRCAIIGSAIAFAIAFWRVRWTQFAAMSLLAALVATMGSTAEAIALRMLWPARAASTGGAKLVPRSSAGWGAAAIVGAFVFLAAGALISAWKKPPREPDIGEAFSLALGGADDPAGSAT